MMKSFLLLAAGFKAAAAQKHASEIDCGPNARLAADWTEKQRDAWCCENRDERCFDCKADWRDWQTQWPKEKQAWCCKTQRLGCADCSQGAEDTWSEDQRQWCCVSAGRGCGNTTVTTVTSTATFTTTTAATMPATTAAATSTAAVSAGPAVAVAVQGPAVAVTGPAVAVQGPQGCFEQDAGWEPMDMVPPRPAASAQECQQHCAETESCAHFTFWSVGGHCHLQDAFAARTPGLLGFTSGPFRCWDALDHSEYVRKDASTFLRKGEACLELATQYEPLLGLMTSLHGMKRNMAVRICRQRCVATKGCEHFTLVMPHQLCRLAGGGAVKMSPYLGSVSGTLSCWEDRNSTAVSDGLEVIMKASLRAHWPAAGTSGAAALLLAFAAVPAAALVVALRRRRGTVRYANAPLVE